MRKLLILAVFLAGCATVTLNTTCPANSTGVSFALSGSAVGNQLLSMLGEAVAAGKVMALKDATTPTTSGTMTYRYVPIFGADSGSLSCAQPLPSPVPPVVVTTGPPAAILH